MFKVKGHLFSLDQGFRMKSYQNRMKSYEKIWKDVCQDVVTPARQDC